MTQAESEFERWKAHVSDKAQLAELEALAADPDELNDAFYQELSFGTAGLRGIIGMGPNRMNVYTVGKATQGFANYLNAHYDAPSVAIARDSRIMGEDFVKAAAGVLAANGIVARVFPRIAPTPTLSFAVRDLGCQGGINVTASHNPAPYNGYKVYGDDGCQIASDVAEAIQKAIDDIDPFADIRSMDFDEALERGMVRWIDDGEYERFVDAVYAQSVEGDRADSAALSVVYTPLNGAGLECVSAILQRIGIADLTVVPEQAEPDGTFATCPYPNPESRPALEYGLRLCERIEPDLLLATDPDADRAAVAVRHDGDYELLTGNELGILMLEYLCEMREERGEDLSDKVVVSTIVSSMMPDALARHYGFQMRRVLTGFKYIGGQISMLEDAGTPERFILGFEESYGYMSGTHVRDKDAVNASMLICQMARWHKSRGSDLVDAMASLYERFGYFLNKTVSLDYPGAAGSEKMKMLTDGLRATAPSELAGRRVKRFVDYSKGAPMPYTNRRQDPEQFLPPADVLEFELEDGCKVLVRPSGTEPKIKAYLFSTGTSTFEAETALRELEGAATELLS